MLEIADEDIEWQRRNDHWRAVKGKPPKRAARERSTAPLILTGHGVSLQVDKGTLFIRNGFTHYPQARETIRLFKGGLDLPPRIIMLDGSGSLSFDVLTWLSEQQLPLIRIDWTGNVVSVIGGSGFPLIQEKVRWQIETRDDPAKRLAFSQNLIQTKIANSVVALRDAVPDSPSREVAIVRADRAIDALEQAEAIDQVRMIEAGAAASYFAAWKEVPLRWERLWKYPVPDTWLTVGPRGAQRSNTVLGSRNATHPLNAMLNYAYGALRSQVQIEAVTAGFDPTIGIMHHSRPDATALVYDLMEVCRPSVDARLLKFVQTEALRGSDFILKADGVVRLAPQLARKVCAYVGEGIRPVLPALTA